MAIYEQNEGVLIEASDIMAGPGYFKLRLHSADTRCAPTDEVKCCHAPDTCRQAISRCTTVCMPCSKGQAAMLGRHEASIPIIAGNKEMLLGVLCLICRPTQALDARYALLPAPAV